MDLFFSEPGNYLTGLLFHSRPVCSIVFAWKSMWQSFSTRYSYSSGTWVSIAYSYSTAQYLHWYSDHELSYSWSEYGFGPLAFSSVFSLIFQTPMVIFKSMQLSSILYCSVLHLCKLCKRSADVVLPRLMTINKSYMVFYLWFILAMHLYVHIYTLHLQVYFH